VDVFVANEQELAFDETRLSSLARHALSEEGIEEGSELSILCVTAEHIRTLNKRFADDDHATDVLAFPMMEDDDADGTLLLGDVVVCPEVAKGNAEELGRELDDELGALVVHGTLHLLGYDHQNETERHKMDTRSAEIIQSFETSVAGSQ
jgi:probable rRNA maturation factor